MGEHRENPKRGYSLTWSWKSVFDYLIKKNWTSQSNDLLVSWNYGTNIYYQLKHIYFTLFHTFMLLTDFRFKNSIAKFFFRQASKTIYVPVSCTWKESLEPIFIRNFASNMSLIYLFHSWLWAARIRPWS